MMSQKDKTSESSELNEENAKNTKTWSLMPFDMKEMIVKEMDIITRTRLKMCSKADKMLVESIPLHISGMKAYSHFEIRCNTARRSPDCEFLTSELQHRFFMLDDLKFSQNGEKVAIWRNNKKRVIKLKNEDEAMKMLNEWYYGILNDKSVRIDQFYTEWVFKDNLISDTRRIPIKSLYINQKKADECVDWLRHIGPVIEKIFVLSGEKLEGVGVLSCILNAKDVTLSDCDINNEQLMNMKASKIVAKHTDVTYIGINSLIKKWINDDYPIGSVFRIGNRSKSTIQQIFEGIEYTVKEKKSQVTRIEVKMTAIKCIMLNVYYSGEMLITGVVS